MGSAVLQRQHGILDGRDLRTERDCLTLHFGVSHHADLSVSPWAPDLQDADMFAPLRHYAAGEKGVS
jgi:hypothetical protein